MEQEVKVSFYLDKTDLKEDGRCPVIARLTIGKSEVKFSAKINVPVKLWACGRAAGKSQAASEINQQLDAIRASALSHYRELATIKDKVTAEEVKRLVLGMAFGQETLLAYFWVHNENFDKRVGVNRKKTSARSYWYSLNYLTKFLKEKYKLSDIPFTALDKSFIDKFDIYLRVEYKLAPGTIVLLTSRLGTIIDNAITEGIITANPFAGYEPEYPERKPKFLTRKELNKLMTTPFIRPKQYLIRDLFLFSCYTGIPYCDMCKLTNENVSVAEDDVVWIKSSRGKTGVDFEVPLLDLPLQILEKYRDFEPGGRLFPMYSSSEMNRQLKQVTSVCGIERNVTWHCARHTYATEITLSQGVPIETVSRMLGHMNITTTQIYAKVTDDKADAEMKALEKRINGRFNFAI